MHAHPGRIFEFGPFRLVESERQLFKDGQSLQLSPKVFETLLVLVENCGRLVEKQELMSRLWPDSFVEDINLNRSISSLRKVLGETASSPLYVETVPKSGYRFLAPVVELESDEAPIVFERYTLARIVTEELEEIGDSSGLGTEHCSTQPAAPAGAVVRTRRQLRVALAAAVGLLACVFTYLIFHATSASGPATPIKSMAVLPFKTIDAGEKNAHQGLGMTDILITRLSNIKDLTVRPTSAILAFENQDQDSVTIGQRINVDAVLEGTIYHANDRVRVTARLIRVSDQSPLWAGQFEKPLQDELRLQDEIALQLVDALALNLSGSEKGALTKRHTESAEAYQLYLEGRYQWNSRNSDGMEQAQRLFRNAIEKDPRFALAYVGLADTLATMTNAGEANLAVEKALELDPNLAEAHATLGFIKMFHEWKWAEAESAIKRSIELNPGYATAHHWYATLLEIQGRNDHAKAEFQRALEIDPMSYNFLADLGQAYYFAHEYDKAKDYCHKSLEIYPDFHFAHWYLSDIYLQTGEYAAAVDEYLTAGVIDFSYRASSSSLQKDRAREYVAIHKARYREAGIRGFLDEPEPANPDPNTSYSIAKRHAFLGDKKRALDSLEAANRGRSFVSAFVKADPVFDKLRSEPRYQAVLRSMGL
jgi:DNA-binding winged helix-turn-helix (wHTH) protein/TolB-like protein/cytochrome c-type biogenesis protein CcmH/NrfG